MRHVATGSARRALVLCRVTRPAFVLTLFVACIPGPAGSDATTDSTGTAGGSSDSGVPTDDDGVTIQDNDSLDALTAMAALTEVEGDLMILFNQELPQVDADAWADMITVGGMRKVAGNQGGHNPGSVPVGV